MSIYFDLQSTSMNLDPLYLMVPIGLSCSFSFMLPVGTPPNSIAYAFGDMDVLSMVCFKI